MPVATCDGFYRTTRGARDMGSSVLGRAGSCTETVGGNTFGWCSCSDGVPRIVNPASRATTCDKMCATPGVYGSDIPALTGSPSTNALSRYTSLRLEKLAGAMLAFLIGCALLVFHAVDTTGTKVGGRKSLVELVKLTRIAPSAT